MELVHPGGFLLAQGALMRLLVTVLLALLGCGGTEPEYPPFDGPAPTVSGFTLSNGLATAVLRDQAGGSTIGRTDYTYVYFYEEGSTDSQVSFASEWTWTRRDNLTWQVTVPNLRKDWPGSAWHVADQDSNVQMYRCTTTGGCEAVPMLLNPSTF
jgi:hypothetical protein